MTYPDPDRSSRFVGEGFRVEPDFRQASGSPEGYPEDDLDPDTEYAPVPATLALGAGPAAARRAVTAAELDGVFDNPAHGEPGRDRFAVHLLWEAVLLVGAAAMAYAVIHSQSGSLSGVNLRNVMISATIVGLLGLGAGATLRAGAVNLAIGPIMVLSALYFGAHADDGFYQAAGIALLIALACGVAIALAVALLQVPGWAASLAAFFGIAVWVSHMPSVAVLSTRYDAAGQGYYWFGGFAIIALVGSVLGAVRPIRRAIGRLRPVSDPADRRGTTAAVVTGLAIVASALLAGLAGIGSTMQVGSVTSTDGVAWTGTAIAIALLGGTSAFGRRGGIFGTLLATALFALADDYVTLNRWRAGDVIVIAIAFGVGVMVTRLVESTGRPRKGGEEMDGATSWLGRQQGSWANELPARPSDEPTWVDASDERWGAR
jgi:ribose/xylose/arabinose/galactoside ABC-type transport system permease subunit